MSLLLVKDVFSIITSVSLTILFSLMVISPFAGRLSASSAAFLAVMHTEDTAHIRSSETVFILTFVSVVVNSVASVVDTNLCLNAIAAIVLIVLLIVNGTVYVVNAFVKIESRPVRPTHYFKMAIYLLVVTCDVFGLNSIWFSLFAFAEFVTLEPLKDEKVPLMKPGSDWYTAFVSTTLAASLLLTVAVGLKINDLINSQDWRIVLHVTVMCAIALLFVAERATIRRLG